MSVQRRPSNQHRSGKAAFETDMSNEGSCQNKTPLFKAGTKRKALRIRRPSDSDHEGQDAEEDLLNVLSETAEIQKLRKRTHGLNAITLAVGKKLSKVDELVNADPDPFKLRSGGLLTLDGARRALRSQNEQEQGAGAEDEMVVGTQFSRETRIRDEDEEMRKFIEVELEKRRGKSDSTLESCASSYLSPEDKALMDLPEHLRKSTAKSNEEMLSSQMLSGIPEVDLGIDEKIRNIEATEAAKKKAAEERSRIKARPSEFVPTNLAVNFKRMNRFRGEDDLFASKAASQPSATKTFTQRTVVVGQMPEERVITIGGKSGDFTHEHDPVRATDDLHVQKFKKHFQRK